MARKKTAAAATETPATTENPRVFIRTRNVGMSGENAYAFHLEGTLTRDLNILPATADKKAMASGSIIIGTDSHGVSYDAGALYARAMREEAPEVKEPSPFVNIIFFGRLAEKVASDEEIKAKAQIAVCGVMKKRTGKDGIERVEVVVDNYTVLHNADAKRNKRISVAPMSYTNSKGEVVCRPMVTLLTGRVLKNIASGQSASSGKNYLRAGLGLAVPVKKVYDLASTGKVGEYKDTDPSILNLVFFDQMAVRMGKLLHEGMQIAVSGFVSEEIYNGNTSYLMRPQSVSVISYGSSDGSNNGSSAAHSAATVDEDAGEAPVASSDDFAGFEDEENEEELPF